MYEFIYTAVKNRQNYHTFPLHPNSSAFSPRFTTFSCPLNKPLFKALALLFRAINKGSNYATFQAFQKEKILKVELILISGIQMDELHFMLHLLMDRLKWFNFGSKIQNF